MRSPLRLAVLASALVCAAARADVVELKNGNIMKGAITRENASELDLDIGYGAVTLKKEDIARVRRAKGAAVKNQDADLRRRRIESGEATPPGGEEVFSAYQKAAELREKRSESGAGRSFEEEKAALAAEIRDIHSRFKAGMERLAQITQDGAPREYRDLVNETQRLSAEGQAKQVQYEELGEQAADADRGSRGYMNAVSDFRRAFDAYAADGAPADGAVRDFRAAMADALKSMEKDLRSNRVVSKDRSGLHLVVDAVVNGKTHLRMIVDTGASYVSLSPKAAARLGPTRATGTIRATLADGRVVETRTIELASLAVGGSRAARVPAVVLPGEMPDADGLLGMSFLGRFSVETDPKAGVLVLRELKKTAPSGAH